MQRRTCASCASSTGPKAQLRLWIVAAPHSGNTFNSNTVTYHATVTVTGLSTSRRFRFLLILHSHLVSPDCELGVSSTPAFNFGTLSLHGSDPNLVTTRQIFTVAFKQSSLRQWRAGTPSSFTTMTPLLLLQHPHPPFRPPKADPSQPWFNFLPPNPSPSPPSPPFSPLPSFSH